jgi:hypothetical protein
MSYEHSIPSCIVDNGTARIAGHQKRQLPWRITGEVSMGFNFELYAGAKGRLTPNSV